MCKTSEMSDRQTFVQGVKQHGHVVLRPAMPGAPSSRVWSAIKGKDARAGSMHCCMKQSEASSIILHTPLQSDWN